MASSRNSKSSGLRILWIPGKRKNNPKGRYDATNKHISHSSTQSNRNQMWSLGGSKSHKHFIETEADTSLLDGPSVSGLSPLAACTITAAAATAKNQVAANEDENNKLSTVSDAPSTPNSASTALLVSLPNSPEPLLINTATTGTTTTSDNTATTTTTTDISGDATLKMPAAKLSTPSSVTTTVAEIIAVDNRFDVFNQNGIGDIDAYDLPTPPRDDPHWHNNLRINTSGDTTNSIATMSSTSPNSDGKSATSSPVKKKTQRNHNNNHHQNDVNSIENVSEGGDQMPNLDWIDDLVLEHQANEIFRKNSKHKKKKQHTTAKELDQLDGVALKNKLSKSDVEKEEKKVIETPEDDKLVKCLYFTLMCCECSIS